MPRCRRLPCRTDRGQPFPVLNTRNGVRSVAYGQSGSWHLELRFMAGNADVQETNPSTSGIDGIYPPGQPPSAMWSAVPNRLHFCGTPSAQTSSASHVLVLTRHRNCHQNPATEATPAPAGKDGARPRTNTDPQGHLPRSCAQVPLLPPASPCSSGSACCWPRCSTHAAEHGWAGPWPGLRPAGPGPGVLGRTPSPCAWAWACLLPSGPAMTSTRPPCWANTRWPTRHWATWPHPYTGDRCGFQSWFRPCIKLPIFMVAQILVTVVR